MGMDVDQTSSSDHFSVLANTESCCAPEAVTFYVSYISVIKNQMEKVKHTKSMCETCSSSPDSQYIFAVN